MKIIIELEIEPGDETGCSEPCVGCADRLKEHALKVVNSILDAGYLQDEINEHNVSDAVRLVVTDASARSD